jgi:hypothetical protein
MMERRHAAQKAATKLKTTAPKTAAKTQAAKTAEATKGRFITLVQNHKNQLELIPNPQAIAEFVEDNRDHLPTDILLKLADPASEQELSEGNRRYNVWGDDATLAELLEDRLANGWHWVQPEEIGALTSAPILEAPDGRIYWHERYQVEASAEELILGRTVKFDGAPENRQPAPGKVPMAASAKKAEVAPAPLAPVPPVPGGNVSPDNPYGQWQTENLITSIETLTDNENFATSKPEQKAVEQMAESLSARPVEREAQEVKKAAALSKAASWLKKQAAGGDDFTRAYIQAALFSTNDNADESGGQPLDANYDPEDIAPETMQQIEADCQKFQRENGEFIRDCDRGSGEYSVEAQAGHDFWLTRNGHGAGFWDGDWPETGDALDKAAKAYGEFDLYVGDDGKLYGTPSRTPKAASIPGKKTCKDCGTPISSGTYCGGIYCAKKPKGWMGPKKDEKKEASIGGSGFAVNDETSKILEGDKSVPDGREAVEDNTGIVRPKTDNPSKFAAGESKHERDKFKEMDDLDENGFCVKCDGPLKGTSWSETSPDRFTHDVCPPKKTAAVSRWQLADDHIEFDRVAVLGTNWSPVYGSYTPERVVELLNKVTVSGLPDTSAGGTRYNGITAKKTAAGKHAEVDMGQYDAMKTAPSGDNSTPNFDARRKQLHEETSNMSPEEFREYLKKSGASTKKADGFTPQNQDTADVLEGDKSVDQTPADEDHTGVNVPATETPTKVAAAPLTTVRALKLAEDLIEELRTLYMDAKPIVNANETRPVREAVESIYHAMKTMGEAVKILEKQKKLEEEEVEAQQKVDTAKGKKSSRLASALVLAAEDEDAEAEEKDETKTASLKGDARSVVKRKVKATA